MGKELNYFKIGDSFGGSQDWFTNVVMHIGGCGAATACDSSIYFAREFGFKRLCPFDAMNLTKDDYIAFSQIMKPYIRPRVGGVRKTDWFISGFSKYMTDLDYCPLQMEAFSGLHDFSQARETLIKQIDSGFPVPYLLLRHVDKEFSEITWHWFLVIGYEEADDDILIYFATYGMRQICSLKKIWDTGFPEKGGMILFKTK
ncbi:MAG: hypothetical protein LBQ95_07660 [Lachnospiraceae bacterium]|nr:hypothetical protein [Lachnospiraceae bacterium]